MIILGRERDFEALEFSEKFSLGGLVDEGQGSGVLAASLKLLVAKTGLVLYEGVPADSDINMFSSHKVYEYQPPLPSQLTGLPIEGS